MIPRENAGMITTARELFDSIERGAAPLVLDVRNLEEFTRWRVEGRSPIDVLNLPYFEFIEEQQASIARVRNWLAGRANDLVVVCAQGGSSEFVAELLRAEGLSPQNLAGGMEAWGRATVERELASAPAGSADLVQFVRFGKGCLSYLLSAGSDALIVDPHRDIDAYERLLHARGLRLQGVIDTHLHADHISGARGLAEAHGVPYHAHADDFEGARFEFQPLREHVPIRLGGLAVTAIRSLHAPGHTPGSSVLVVNDTFVLSGDTLFIGSAGRPDLAGKTAEWGRDLYRTLHRRMGKLPDEMLVLPAHTAGPQEMREDGTVAARLGDLRRENPALRADEATFLESLASGIVPAPEHYARIRSINLGTITCSPEEATEMELGKNECALARRH
jgi:glyoxylase-like metal-dependent hydrolase (beta-lactamase superfamily II)